MSPAFGADEADGDIRFVRDLAGLSPPPGVDWLTFARPNVFPVASSSWIAAHTHVKSPADLLSLRLLHEESDEEWKAWFVAHEISVGARLLGPRLWHAHLTLDAARRRHGVCLANPFLIADDLPQGLLQTVLEGYAPGAGRPIGSYVFATREDALCRPAIRKFRDWLVARAAAFLAEREPPVAARVLELQG